MKRNVASQNTKIKYGREKEEAAETARAILRCNAFVYIIVR